MTVQRQIDRLIAQRASEWVEILKTAGPAEREAFVDWLRESRRHVEEFLAMVALDRELDGVKLQGMDRQALIARLAPGVIPLPSGVSQQTSVGQRRTLPWRRISAIAAGIAMLSLALLFLREKPSTVQDFITQARERQSVELADGSVVQLNAHSRVRVRLSASARDLELLSGEALFKVARDSRRPFRVRTRDALVQALGTQFNISTRAETTTISVLEGKVRVTADGGTTQNGAGLSGNSQRPSSPGAAAALGAGEQVLVHRSGTMERGDKPDVAVAAAWHRQRLVFQSSPLENVVREFNRHNAVPKLKLEGVAPDSHHYSATFDADDPESFASLLTHEQDLAVERRADEVIIRPRGP